ncbi:Alpha/Beta hydrolase protein [Zopfochytrium polystomum]|nr:Alpha/Beta hydrolase protein [Zopfochytrium polystomum]
MCPLPAAPPGLSSHDSGSSATTTGGSSNTIRIHLFYPALIREYPQAKFPAVAVFTEIYQVTGPVQRFCRQIAANGYIVGCPESYHEFEAPGVVIPYDVEGTDRGNRYKMEKLLTAYDQDATLVLDALAAHPNCNGRLGATGMCLGGHLAFRCAFDRRVLASVCYFATDIHGSTLGKNNDPNNTSLARCKEIKGGGKHDNHIPQHGRQLIYQTLASAGADFGWVELPAQHAFIRDELSKGRYDPPLAKICFEVLLELFHRKLDLDLGAAAVAAAGQSNAGAQQQQPLVC